ncbi:DUF4402 domain-containing protein [Altererythrobacter sp. H2]|uniref:DUF4402 domain-containing protein n=1 Tax=Altererythrobacter sp. H2 TaxID=3108391 RepID=UPI002B4BCE47|nr:DUF4402 domain-containing protein [Altererythrobacter sp. H2]WRK96043.1 DUF4402 domain-containing protein [Altererythrobacter sp. H2]
MIKTLRMGAAGAAIAAMALASAANAAETATATATADVVQAFTVTKDADLDFGAIVVDPAGGDVTVSAAGVLSCGAGFVCHGTNSAAAFSIDGGTIGKRLFIDLPDTSGGALVMLHSDSAALVSGGAVAASVEIELDSFTTDAAFDALSGKHYVDIADAGLAGGGTATGVGEAAFAVGGTATFDGSEVEGTYSVNFDVTVDYE